MLRYLYADQVSEFPALRDAMFRDRATQFRDRLGWAVTVDEQGMERDEYDALNPLYVIWQNPDGGHGGSMRFLPTVGPTMINDHFADLIGGAALQSPLIWECTRFCLSPDADTRVAAALMLGGGELMRSFGLSHLIGVFDDRMTRIYRRIGAAPEVLGAGEKFGSRISVGLWPYTPASRARVLLRAGLSSDLSERWFARSFGMVIPRGSRQVAAKGHEAVVLPLRRAG